ncbi:ERG2/sigma1 receptor-like protein [Limtongia smithiae]|uniref:ERG2/sigma1 receptor-like protein n=1 Tax=Limtongia smithiae TaxID=1125753 RepID=UPI0034CF7E5C
MVAWFKFSVVLALLVVLYSYVDKYVLPTLYIFDPNTLQQIVNDALATVPSGNTTALFVDINKRLREVYGDNVNEFNNDDWMFNNAGNAMGAMFIQHASLSEYLIFFGTAIGTEGHTGVHPSNDYFFILEGEQRAHALGNPEPEIYRPGDMHWLHRGYAKQYSMPSTTWALELAQGWIPGMLPFGLADIVFSTLDFGTFIRTAYFTAKAMGESALRGKF